VKDALADEAFDLQIECLSTDETISLIGARGRGDGGIA
jgi:hypothetical protein